MLASTRLAELAASACTAVLLIGLAAPLSAIADNHDTSQELAPVAASQSLREMETMHPAALAEPAGNAVQKSAQPSGGMESLEPYKLIRSLQFVQDAVVMGDHSAMEMQRYLLGVIDNRLRAADQRVFDDPRNVDAALIYAMSGGNPATLDLLAIQDRFGNFDNEVTTVLRAYLDGRATSAKSTLEDVVNIYRESEIGPYLTLVAANVTAGMNDESALGLFDWARLAAPGTLVEEAALRRSLFIATRKGLVDKAIEYASLYARRFINSPYAGQYADLLVDLVEGHYEELGEEKLGRILAFMNKPRQREVYLRISRRAVINGKKDLALHSASRAEELSDSADTAPAALASLYSSMADVSSVNVGEASKALDAVSVSNLSPRDAALRDAARLIAGEVLREPDPNSLTQAFSSNVSTGSQREIAPDPVHGANMDAADKSGLDGVKFESDAASAEPSPGTGEDDRFRGFVEGREKILQEIDSLLAGLDGAEGT